MEREERHLDGESQCKGQEGERLDARVQGGALQFQDVECAGLGIDGQDADEHQRGAGEGVQEELHGDVDATPAAPFSDQEVHRDQAELEEDEEEHEVQRQEDADHGGLQDEHETSGRGRSARGRRGC